MALRDPRILEHTLSAGQRTALQELVGRSRAHFGAKLEDIRLFGSRARGDAEEESDIDLLFVLRDEPETSDRAFLRDVVVELEVRTRLFLPFSLQVLSRAHFERLRSRERRFALDVEREGIRL